MIRTYLDDYSFDLMTEEELDVFENAKERITQNSWNERTAMCGMTYGQIEELNNKMFELEWKR